MCSRCLRKPYCVCTLDKVIPNEEHRTNRPIIKFNILYFFYITIRKIQQKYQNTKNNRIITRDSLYSTIKKIPIVNTTGMFDKKQ